MPAKPLSVSNFKAPYSGHFRHTGFRTNYSKKHQCGVTPQRLLCLQQQIRPNLQWIE